MKLLVKIYMKNSLTWRKEYLKRTFHCDSYDRAHEIVSRWVGELNHCAEIVNCETKESTKYFPEVDGEIDDSYSTLEEESW